MPKKPTNFMAEAALRKKYEELISQHGDRIPDEFSIPESFQSRIDMPPQDVLYKQPGPVQDEEILKFLQELTGQAEVKSPHASSGAASPGAARAAAREAATTGAAGATGAAAEAEKALTMGGKVMKYGGKAFTALNAVLVPLMIAQMGLELHDRMGGDMFGQKKRRRTLAADDLNFLLDSQGSANAQRVREEDVLPGLLKGASMYQDPGTSFGIQEARQGTAMDNYINTRAQDLGNMAVPSSNQLTLTEQAARMGLPV